MAAIAPAVGFWVLPAVFLATSWPEIRATPSSPDRSGNVLHSLGVRTYTTAAVTVCLLYLILGNKLAAGPLVALFAVPILAPFVLLALAPASFIVGTLTGTPIVCFTYALCAIKRDQRGLVGGILLLGVLASAVTAVANLPTYGVSGEAISILALMLLTPLLGPVYIHLVQRTVATRLMMAAKHLSVFS
jgi:hypothetical protein